MKKAIMLTEREQQILDVLEKNVGKVVSRSTIRIACGMHASESNAIDVHVKNLRRKVPNTIETVRGYGYRMM